VPPVQLTEALIVVTVAGDLGATDVTQPRSCARGLRGCSAVLRR